jgi:glycosyltransferase involved in cell wall biosynthesis
MRVVLAQDWITGAGQDLRTLQSLAALFPESKIATMFYDHRHLPPDISNHQLETSFLQKIPGKTKYSHHLIPVYIRAIRNFSFNDIDLLISNTRGYAKGIAVPDSVLHICYLHQPMAFAWQSLDLQFPQSEINRVRYKFIENLSAKFRRWDIESTKRVHLFLADCDETAHLIMDYYNRPSKVIYPPVDTDYFTPESSIKGKYFLMVGPIKRNRRIEIAVEAFRDIREKLIIVGDGVDFYRLVNSSSPNVNFTGHADDAKLRQLYRDCKALIITSNNSFHMAAIEAAACGKPVISLAHNIIGETDGEQVSSKNVNFIVNNNGIYADECSVLALKEALRIFNQSSFSSELLRQKSLHYSKQEFFRHMRDFLAEAYSLFRQDGRLNFEQRLLR